MKALLGANLIDGTGGPVLKDSAILIDGERIIEVGPRAAVTLPPGTEKIDLTGLTLLPGLIDTHDHLSSKNYNLMSRWEVEEPNSMSTLKTAKAIEESLLAGYTCIRDAGGLDAGFKFAVEECLLIGPRLCPLFHPPAESETASLPQATGMYILPTPCARLVWPTARTMFGLWYANWCGLVPT